MNDPRREILSQVASGALTAEEGAARLEALESGPAASPPPPRVPSGAPVTRVEVLTRFGDTEVVGDPSVAYAVAEGPHRARQDGDVMVIEQSPLSDDASFEFTRPYARITIPGFGFHHKLTVRMNPELALKTTVQAGNLRIEGVKGAVTSDVQAGNCTVEGFAGPIKLSVSAGNIVARGRLDGGVSSIRCRMGEAQVSLDRTSSVRINAHTTMGEVVVDGVEHQTVGSGAGVLDIKCTMGNVRVTVA